MPFTDFWMSILNRIRRGFAAVGWRYPFRVPINELRNPRLTASARVRSGLVRTMEKFHAPPTVQDAWWHGRLVLPYDLACAPVTFDFASYLAAAELERRERDLDGLVVVFVPGPHDGFRKEALDYEDVVPLPARQWRVRHILQPMLTLLPTVQGHVVCSTREQAAALVPAVDDALYPSDYRIWMPRLPIKRSLHERAARGGEIWPMFSATEGAKQYVVEFLARVANGRRVLVITLRESRAAAARNSRLEDWAAFLRGLDRTRYCPVLVRDTEALGSEPPGILDDELFYPAAALDLDIRMALYEAAWLNLAVMHGPMELCWYNHRVRYAVFLQPDADPTSSPDSIREGGQPFGTDLAFATPFQRVVWEADTAASISATFVHMVQLLEESAPETR